MMNVLGIESSCDETSAAVVRADGEVLANVVYSQIEVHAPYGGVVPELASRAHMRAVAPVVRQALRTLPHGFADIHGIAFTQGPGLIGALLVGVQAAKAIAYARSLPMVGVDHLLGHLFAIYLHSSGQSWSVPKMPFVALLVSGGHTGLYEVRDINHVTLLGQTRDDAAGEAYDKVAKMLGLGYPGGPIVDRLAQEGDPLAVRLPKPMVQSAAIEFSFSGLKTAVAQHLRANGMPATDGQLADLCASFQNAVVEVLISKSLAALEQQGIDRLVLTGGVAANRGLRARAQAACDSRAAQLYIPPLHFCTDNAAMIACAGSQLLARGERAGTDAAAFSRSMLGQVVEEQCKEL
jgi:N6-L-threonylcarbamoyladenine synthase